MENGDWWEDDDTFLRTNYRTRPYASAANDYSSTSRVIGMDTKRRTATTARAGTRSSQTCPGRGIPGSIAASLRGNR